MISLWKMNILHCKNTADVIRQNSRYSRNCRKYFLPIFPIPPPTQKKQRDFKPLI